MFERGFLWWKSIVKTLFFGLWSRKRMAHGRQQLFLLFRTSWRSLTSWAQHDPPNRLFKFALPCAWHSHSIAFRKNIKNFTRLHDVTPTGSCQIGTVWGLPHCHIFSLHYSQSFDITIIFVFNLIRFASFLQINSLKNVNIITWQKLIEFFFNQITGKMKTDYYLLAHLYIFTFTFFNIKSDYLL